MRVISEKWIVLSGGTPIGLDRDSGGYPYKTLHPSSIKYWDTKEKAEDYVNVMTRGVDKDTYLQNPKILQATLSIEE